MTEAGGGNTVSAPDSKRGPVARPLPGVIVRTCDAEGKELPTRSRGEVCVRFRGWVLSRRGSRRSLQRSRPRFPSAWRSLLCRWETCLDGRFLRCCRFVIPPRRSAAGCSWKSGLAGTTDPVRVRTARRENRAPIVVVGCGCCLPGGAEDPSRFWQLRLIADGVAATQDISRWDMDAVVPPAGAAALHSLPQQPDRAGEAVDGRSVFIAPAICLDGPATDSSSLDSALREAHEPAPEWIDAEGNRSRPVFQWATSGSTGRPKVVVED